MKIIQCQQGTEEWFAARRGIATASEFSRVLTPAKGKLSAQAQDYACELVAELAINETPEAIESFTSRAMQYGIDTEGEARKFYQFDRDAEVSQVGFCVTDCGRFGCSPDGLVGDDGGLELKCPLPKTQVQYLVNEGLPDCYKCQVHGALVVTGRPWWDFMSYCHGLPPLIIRVHRDEFTDKLADALDEFWTKFYEPAFAKVKAMGGFDYAAGPSAEEVEEFVF